MADRAGAGASGRAAQESPPPAIDARLFGELAVEVDGVAVEGALVGKARSLLQYLLITGRPAHREVLMEVFWPGFDAGRARNNLNVTMNALRRALGPTGHALLVLRAGCYGFAPGASVTTDVAAFAGALHHARALERAGHAALALQAYEVAVDSYGGELVAEDPYSEWLEAPREYHRAAHLDALEAHRPHRPRARPPGRRHPGLPGRTARRQPRRGRRRAADDVVPGPRADLAGVEDLRRLPAAAGAAACGHGRRRAWTASSSARWRSVRHQARRGKRQRRGAIKGRSRGCSMRRSCRSPSG